VAGEGFVTERFRTETAGLRKMAAWLRERGVTSAAMESTGVYWDAPMRILRESGTEAVLVNAKEIKSVSGRPKTDKNDCQWICRLHAYGLLRGSFIPETHVSGLRAVWDFRESLVADNGRVIQRMNQALLRMNIRLDIAVSAITGESGMRIISAILSGERDPVRLAGLADKRLKKPREEIAMALDGAYDEPRLWALRQWRDQYIFNLAQIQKAGDEIVRLLRSFPAKTEAAENALPPKVPNYREDYLGFDEPLRPLRLRVFGADLTRIPGVAGSVILSFLTTVGTDVSAWPAEKHFKSWLGLSPNPQISAGRARQGAPKKVRNPLSLALKTAAMSVQRTETFLGECHRRLKTRLGPAKAKKIIAGKMAVILYRLIKSGGKALRYDAAKYEEKYKERRLKYLERQARMMGCVLTPAPAGA
jgi:transposase